MGTSAVHGWPSCCGCKTVATLPPHAGAAHAGSGGGARGASGGAASDQLRALIERAVKNFYYFSLRVVGDASLHLHRLLGFIRQQLPQNRHVRAIRAPSLWRLLGRRSRSLYRSRAAWLARLASASTSRHLDSNLGVKTLNLLRI